MGTMINGLGPERIEHLTFAAALQTSGDLELGTKVITATAEASGIGNADYSSALILADPDDARLAVLSIGTRLSFTISAFDVATILYCRVYVDAQDADHLLFDTSHNAVSNKLAAQVTNASTKAVIFNLLKDGAAHTFYFFFWVNQANSASIQVVQLWEANGSTGASGFGDGPFICLDFTGEVQISGGQWIVLGTGTATVQITAKTNEANHSYTVRYEDSASTGQVWAAEEIWRHSMLSPGQMWIRLMEGTVATDLLYISGLSFVLRSES